MALPFLVSNVTRRPGGGGGDGQLTLPHLSNFVGESAGALTKEGWGQSGYPYNSGNFLSPTVVSNKAAGWDPGMPCLYFNSDATNCSVIQYTLPGYIDADAGFQMVFWACYETNAHANTNFLALDTPHDPSLYDYNGILVSPRNVSPQDYELYGYVDKIGTKHTPTKLYTGGTVWCRHAIKWDPTGATKYVSTSVYQVHDSTERNKQDNIGVTWGSAVAADYHQVTHFIVYNNVQANVYCRDLWFLGVWFGSLSDSLPALQMPSSL